MTDAQAAGRARYEEREKRLLDAVALKETDRVPFVYFAIFWLAKYGGFTCQEAMYDYDKLSSTARDALVELEPDAFAPPHPTVAMGPAMETLGYKQLLWPGHGVDENVSYQYLDQEYMKADEYEDYVFDPTGFYLRTYLPRVASAFEPFAKLPDFPSVYYFQLIHASRRFAQPDLVGAFETLAKAGNQTRDMLHKSFAFVEEMAKLGFPMAQTATTNAPYDYFADNLRGSKGIMLDTFRNKDKLLEAMDKSIHFLLRGAADVASRSPCKIVFIPIHWGLDGFMSPDHFKTFFWEPFRKLMLGLIERDLIPCAFWQGNCNSRLEVIQDLPPGKAIYWFEQTDMFKAKEVLGDTICIRGNVPASLLNLGTPEDVDAYCKSLIEGVGKGGGFILDGANGIPDEAKVENVRAMAASVRKYAAG